MKGGEKMNTNDLKKVLSGLSIVSLLAGVGMGTTACSMTETNGASGVQHPTQGSEPMEHVTS